MSYVMETVLVNKETLQKLLDFIGPEESKDFEKCFLSDWPEHELEQHAFKLIQELQDCINTQ